MAFSAAALALALTARAALQVPSPAPPHFPAGTRLIRLDVSVVDRQGPTLLQLARGDRVTEHLEKDRSASAPQLIASVRDAATEWTGSEEPVDDQTIVVVRRTES